MIGAANCEKRDAATSTGKVKEGAVENTTSGNCHDAGYLNPLGDIDQARHHLLLI